MNKDELEFKKNTIKALAKPKPKGKKGRPPARFNVPEMV